MSVVASPPAQDVPARVRMAIGFLLTAVALGVAETVLVAGQAVYAGQLPGLAYELVVRAGIYSVLAWLVLRLRKGGNGTRIIATVLLGVFGTLSMIVAPLMWMLDGNSPIAFLAGADGMTLLFAVMRTGHVVAVLSGVALLFTPQANVFFRRR